MGWSQLSAILAEAAEEANRVDPPTACPNDGTPLTKGPDGVLHCTLDGWIWDGTTAV